MSEFPKLHSGSRPKNGEGKCLWTIKVEPSGEAAESGVGPGPDTEIVADTTQTIASVGHCIHQTPKEHQAETK